MHCGIGFRRFKTEERAKAHGTKGNPTRATRSPYSARDLLAPHRASLHSASPFTSLAMPNHDARVALSTRDHTPPPLSPRELMTSPPSTRRSLQRPPSQRQMLEMAFEGETSQPVGEELESNIMISSRSRGGTSARGSLSHRSRTGSYDPQYYEQSPSNPHLAQATGSYQYQSRPSSGSWPQHLQYQSYPASQASTVSIVPITPSYGSLALALPRQLPDESAMVVEGENPELFQAGVLEHAQRLGIDPNSEADLLWIARESLIAQLPPGWISAKATETGAPYYYNTLTGESMWDHPCDEQFRQMVEDVRRRQSCDGSSHRFSSGDMHTASFYEEQQGYEGGPAALAWQESGYSDMEYATSDRLGDIPDPAHDDMYSEGYDQSRTTGSSSHGYDSTADYEVADPFSTPVMDDRQQSVVFGASRDEIEFLQNRVRELESKNKELQDQQGLDDALILKLEEEMMRLAERVKQHQETKPNSDSTANTELESMLRETKDALEESERKVSNLLSSNQIMEKELADIRKKDTVATGETLQALRGECEELKLSLTRESSLRQKIEEDLDATRKESAKKHEELHAAKQAIEALGQDCARLSRRDQEQADVATTTAANAANALAASESKLMSVSSQLANRTDELNAALSGVSTLRAEIDELKQEHSRALQEQQKKLEEELARRDDMLAAVQEELRYSNNTYQATLREKSDLESKLSQQVQMAAMQQAEAEDMQRSLKRDIRALERDLKALQSVSKEREDEFAAAKRVMQTLEQRLLEQDTIVAAAKQEGYREAEKAAAEKIRQIQAEKTRMSDLYTQELQTRRKLHNRLMELQGNIRVFCRVRPIQAVELKSEQSSTAVFFRDNDAESLDLVVGGELGPDGKLTNGAGQKHQFEFDHVFQPSSTQEEVFEQTKALVTSALDGFNVCIFAYGQTGSGKTHTMEGPESDRGVNFRSLTELFKIRDERVSTGNFECCMKISILEVYNEVVYDLLDKAPSSSISDQRKGLEIRMGKQGVFVENLIEVEVANEKDVVDLMKLGKANRSVGSHDFNEHSSRSHLVLSIAIETFQKSENRRRLSKLHLIDLAGSERVSKTAASGQRLKEAQNINRSLSALGDVIAALGANSKHVPYRNSKLTYLLQESLSGNSKVLMFVNVSPVQWNAWETLCSLNFASRCRNVALGLAKASNGATSSPSVTKEFGSSSASSSSSNASMARNSGGGSGVRAAPSPPVKGTQRVVYG